MGHRLRFPFLGVSSSIARVAIFIGSSYGKKADTCSVGLWLEYQRNKVSFCPLRTVASVETVALHPRGFSALLRGWRGFSGLSTSREKVVQLACQGTRDCWRLYACCLAGLNSTSLVPSTEVVAGFTAVWAEGSCV